MNDRPFDRWQRKKFVCREVELDTGKVAAPRRDRAAIIYPPLARQSVSLVSKNIKPLALGGYLKAGLFVDPCRDVGERLCQERLIEMGFIGNREVEVFREAIRLEIAFLEAGSALEYPMVAEVRVGADAGQEPAQHIIFSTTRGCKPRFSASSKSSRRSIMIAAPSQRAEPRPKSAESRAATP